MKKIIFALGFIGFLIAGCAPLIHANPPPIVKDGMVIRTLQQDAELKDWILGLQAENAKNKARATAADLHETEALVALNEAQGKTKALQVSIDSLQAESDKNVRLRQAAETLATEKTKEAHENAKERDVVILAFAVMFALWIAAKTGTLVSQAFPQYSILAQAILFVVSLSVGYAMGRFVLMFFAKFIP